MTAERREPRPQRSYQRRETEDCDGAPRRAHSLLRKSLPGSGSPPSPLRSASTLKRSPISPGNTSVLSALRCAQRRPVHRGARRLRDQRRKQKLRLRRESSHARAPPRAPRRQHALKSTHAEMSCRPGIEKRVCVGAVPIVANQRAARALLVIVARGARGHSRRTTSNRARATLPRSRTMPADAGTSSLRKPSGSGAPSAPSSAATAAPSSSFSGPSAHANPRAVRDHAARQRAPAALHEARHGQRVEHLVRDHGAVERLLGEAIEPCDTVAEARERAALTLAQVGARLEDPIRDARVAERVEDLRRERAATRAELENERRSAARELGSQRARERAAEKSP